MNRHMRLLCLAGLLTPFGCGSTESSTPTRSAPPTVANGTTDPPLLTTPSVTTEPPASAVKLDVKSWEETLALVAEHQGKIVVLDLWSTSCEPCLAEFPNLVALHENRGQEDVVCLSANCDYIGLKSKPPESYVPNVLEFLTKQKATFQNMLLNVDADELFEKIELASIPAVFVFGRDGQLAKRFDNDLAKKDEEFTYQEDVIPFVEGLLSK